MTRGPKASKKTTKKNTVGGGKGEHSSTPNACPKAGVDKIHEDEELQYDPSTYNCLHSFSIGWPCLSFDILHDYLGIVRTEFPHTIFGVAGTQADKSYSNYIGVFKMSSISGKKRAPMGEPSIDSSSEEENEEDNDLSSRPNLELQKIDHEGGVNRIRAMPQNPMIVASWSDKGYVQVWDVGSRAKTLDSIFHNGGSVMRSLSPMIKFKGHRTEGFALQWNPCAPGRLVSGDCNGKIHLWEPSSGTLHVGIEPFKGHTASVEDLQWSPEDVNIFASCSADKRIAIWDIRCGKSPDFVFQAHNSDVNVISWNRHSKGGKELAAGSDDGSLSIHDLRKIESKTVEASCIARQDYHKHPITSIEWSPHDPSTLAASSSDNQLTIWDFSAESDKEDYIEEQVQVPEDLSPNLLFVHQGQIDIKEVHWHAQIPGMLLSTASDCFNILMPANL